MGSLLANRWLMCRKQVRSGGRQLKAASAEHMLPLLLTIGTSPVKLAWTSTVQVGSLVRFLLFFASWFPIFRWLPESCAIVCRCSHQQRQTWGSPSSQQQETCPRCFWVQGQEIKVPHATLQHSNTCTTVNRLLCIL
jgi:hypothetical protein